MAGIFDLAPIGGRTGDIIACIGSVALESLYHVVPSQSNDDFTRTIGTIVSAAGFPEFGVPIALGGYLLRRWIDSGSTGHSKMVP